LIINLICLTEHNMTVISYAIMAKCYLHGGRAVHVAVV
jgi:hypothetical protein